jgi:hypothetical protein
MIESIKKAFVDKAATAVVVGLSSILVFIFGPISKALFAFVAIKVSSEKALAAFFLSFLANIGFAVYLWIRSREPQETYKFSLIWRNKIPYCPGCNRGLFNPDKHNLICYKCNADFPLKDEHGRVYDLAEAIRLLS